MKKFFIGILIFCSLTLVFIAVGLALYIQKADEEFLNTIEIKNDGVTYEVFKGNLSLAPSESESFEIELFSKLDGKYYVTLDFSERKNGKISQYVDVTILVGNKEVYSDVTLKELFEADEPVEFELELPVGDIEKIVIVYSIDSRRGNEVENTYSDFNIELKVERIVGDN